MQSFNSEEPPGRPVPPPPPICTVLPNVAFIAGLEVGDVLAGAVGTWSPGAGNNYDRQWYRGGRIILGATGITYTIAPPDVGFMIVFAVRATTPAGGQNLAAATAVGPCVPASPRAGKTRK
jgi:hypothetical protein